MELNSHRHVSYWRTLYWNHSISVYRLWKWQRKCKRKLKSLSRKVKETTVNRKESFKLYLKQENKNYHKL